MSYYSESATAQASAPQKPVSLLSVSRGAATCHQSVQSGPPVKLEAENSQAGANYMVYLWGFASLSAVDAPARYSAWMSHGESMIGVISVVVLQVMVGLRRDSCCEPGLDMCSANTLLSPMLLRTLLIKAGRKLANYLRKLRRWDIARFSTRLEILYGFSGFFSQRCRWTRKRTDPKQGGYGRRNIVDISHDGRTHSLTMATCRRKHGKDIRIVGGTMLRRVYLVLCLQFKSAHGMIETNRQEESSATLQLDEAAPVPNPEVGILDEHRHFADSPEAPILLKLNIA